MNRDIQTVQRNTLFYGRYKYSVRLICKWMFHLRSWNLDRIQIRLDTPIQQTRYYNYGGSWMNKINTKTSASALLASPQEREYMINLAKLLIPLKEEGTIKTLISHDLLQVYTNNEELVEILSGLSQHNEDIVIQAEPIGSSEIMAFKNPPAYSYRTYFKNYTLNTAQKQNLENVLLTPEVKPSKSLQEFFDRNQTMLFEHYFFEFNNASYESMVALTVPQAIRKTVRCVYHK